MREFELILCIVLAALLFFKRPILKFLKRNISLSLLLLSLAIHLIIEGYRWQMIPLYFLIIILVLQILRIKENDKPKLNFLRILKYCCLTLVLALGIILPNALPVFELPTPTGKYSVGTTNILVQTDYDEVITSDPSDKREFMVKVWYPSNSVLGYMEDPYFDKANRENFSAKYGGGILTASSMNYLDYINTHVYQDADIADERFPVLIFSHGYGSNATGYYALLTELASHGYIIINMNHTYESLGTEFPDGTQKNFDYTFQYESGKGAMDQIKPIKEAFEQDLTYEERHSIIRKASKDYNVTKMVKRWTKDIVYVMDQLESWNKRGFLRNRMNLNKIGVFGHSRGGGTAGQVTITDDRIKAAANIDGVQWGEMMDTIYQKPFLYISADWSDDHEDINAHVYKNKSTDYFYEAKLLKSQHPNFMDIPLMIPVKSLAQTGEIEAELGLEITNSLLVNFFDKHLKGIQAKDLTQLSNSYDLLELKVYKNGTQELN